MEFLSKLKEVVLGEQARSGDPFDLFKDLVWDTALEALTGAIAGALPGWLSWLAPIGIGMLVSFTDKFYSTLKLIVDMENVRIKNEDLRKQYSVASVQLRLLIESQNLDTEEKLKNSEAFQNARKAHRAALKKLAQFNPLPVAG